MNRRRIARMRSKAKFVFDLVGNERIRVHALQAIPFWIASLLTGVVAVAYTRLFGYAEAALQALMHWKLWMLFLVTPLCFFIAWLLVVKFAPNAKGSGIPQVMAAIELARPERETKIGKLLSIRISCIKILSSFFMVLGGGAIGREGPTIQIAGSIFHQIRKWVPASWPRLSNQSFVLTGAAAGLAAAFNTPLGGVVFAMEELAKIHVKHFRTALFSAVIIAGLTAQGLLGPYLYLGFPKVNDPGVAIFLGVALTAIIGGAAASYMCKGILAIMRWKAGFTRTQTLIFLIAAGLVIATVAYLLNGEILGSGKELMMRELFTDEKAVSWHTVVMRIAGPMICFNTGAAGGVFAPSLAAGASLGGLISSLFHVVGANANILILSGMVAFLTGVTRTPFTSAILVLEMTDRHSVIFHLMLAAMIANIAALVIDKHSFYDQLKAGYLKDMEEH